MNEQGLTLWIPAVLSLKAGDLEDKLISHHSGILKVITKKKAKKLFDKFKSYQLVDISQTVCIL